MGAARTEVRDLSLQRGELAFTLTGPFGSHRVRFWGDLPHGGSASVEPALAVAILPAMAAGGILSLPDPPDPQLRRALGDIQAVLAVHAEGCAMADRELTPVAVSAPGARPASRETGGTKVGTLFSGGVDSWEVVLSDPEITELIYVHGFDIPIEQAGVSAVVEERLGKTAAKLGKRLRVVRTNVRDLLDPAIDWQIAHGPALAAVALLFQPLCERVVIGSSDTYGELVPRGSHPLHDHLWSTERLRIEHRGADLTRTAKVEHLAAHQEALDVLRVCWENVDSFNCGRCEKCLRTMTALNVVGSLERCPTFVVPLDLEAVAKLRFADPNLPIWWRENLELARRHDASAELIGAIEECLAANDRKSRLEGD